MREWDWVGFGGLGPNQFKTVKLSEAEAALAEAQAQLAAAEKREADVREKMEILTGDFTDRIAALENACACLRAACNRSDAENERLKALSCTKAQQCFVRIDPAPPAPARPDAVYDAVGALGRKRRRSHDKAHCPAVVHKGEYDRDTCYIDHDKKRRRSK